MKATTDYMIANPLKAALRVSELTGIEPEVVYLYNGPGGTSFVTTLKPSLTDALKNDVPYLKSIGEFANLDVTNFVQDGPLRAAFSIITRLFRALTRSFRLTFTFRVVRRDRRCSFTRL